MKFKLFSKDQNMEKDLVKKKIETNQQKVLSLNFTEQVLQATKWQNISFIDSLVDNRNYLYINMPHSHSHGNIRNHAYFP